MSSPSTSSTAGRGSAIVGVFTLTLFASALLLFLVQPMVAKMILPRLGGTSSVWNTCMVFFQALLLLGYLYAHVISRMLKVGPQVMIHLALMGAAFFFLPIAFGSSAPPTDGAPALWLLAQLGLAVGVPFLVVSSSAPLFQTWFSRTGHPHGDDPYYLYAASNAGSLVALLAYPLIVERSLNLADQATAWAVGFGVLLAMAALCGGMAWKLSAGDAGVDANLRISSSENGPDRRQILRWLLYAFIPSSLLLGVTTYITNDVASVPLLWVVPLALYLLTFVFVFARRQVLPHKIMVHAMHVILVPMAVLVFLQPKQPVGLAIVLHPLLFFIVAMVFHGELARTRPAARHLTQFYLWMSVGGVLGGIFNALLAPIIFSSLVEYPLVMGLAFLALPTTLLQWSKATKPQLIGLIAVSSIAAAVLWLSIVDPENDELIIHVLVIAIAVVMSSISFRGSPRNVMLILLGGVLVGAGVQAAMMHYLSDNRILYNTRNYFGIHQVMHNEDAQLRHIFHGTTDHGQQSTREELRRTALAYHHPDGPLGDVFAELAGRPGLPAVGVIGLGAGAIAAYGKPGQRVVFYEIDPAVAYIATNPDFFTYLPDCGEACEIVLGDGRLTLMDAADGAYGVLVLDAFSSDSVPVHLITREAVATYVSKITSDGLLAFNVSNRYLDLEPVLGNLAKDQNLVGRIQHYSPSPEAAQTHSMASSWVVLAHDESHLGAIATNPRWRVLKPAPTHSLWTDDYSNIIEVYKWFGAGK